MNDKKVIFALLILVFVTAIIFFIVKINTSDDKKIKKRI